MPERNDSLSLFFSSKVIRDWLGASYSSGRKEPGPNELPSEHAGVQNPDISTDILCS